MWLQSMSALKAMYAIALIGMTICLAGCSRRIEQSEVLGRYTVNRGKGVDEIELKKDGTYLYTCKLGNSSDFENMDHWSFRYDNGDARITFDHFQFCAEEYRRKPPTGMCKLNVPGLAQSS